MSDSHGGEPAADPRREGRAPLGDPNSNGSTETETWINFLREGHHSSMERHRSIEAGDLATRRAIIQSRRASAGSNSASASDRTLLDSMGRLLSSEVNKMTKYNF